MLTTRELYLNRIKKTQTNYNVNDVVTWSSHSPKGRSIKTGTIIAVVAPEQDVKHMPIEWHKYTLPQSLGNPRALRSYLISVKVEAKRGKKDKLYFPFPNCLRLVK
jgi:hypothetical protein